MLLLILIMFAMLGVAGDPDVVASHLSRLDTLIERLDTIALNVQPPLPVPLMAAAILFVFFTNIPARFAAAWCVLVDKANTSQGCWAAPVIMIDRKLAPFKLRGLDEVLAVARNAQVTADAASASANAANTTADAANTTADAARASADAVHASIESIRKRLIILENQCQELKHKLQATSQDEGPPTRVQGLTVEGEEKKS